MLKLLQSRRAGLLAGALLLSAALVPPLAATTLEFEFDADNFDNPLVIDNQYWPQVPGTVFTYKAETPDGCEWSQVTVTNDTKDITVPGQDTITVRVVTDFEYEDEDCSGIDDDELVEKTFDWYGQDDLGNIWYFGENTQDCDGADNCEAGEGAWEAGVNGALPGIIMLADPDSGERYRQELAEDVAEDWGMVMNLNGMPVLRLEDASSRPVNGTTAWSSRNGMSLNPAQLNRRLIVRTPTASCWSKSTAASSSDLSWSNRLLLQRAQTHSRFACPSHKVSHPS